jgi:hypothetical protein
MPNAGAGGRLPPTPATGFPPARGSNLGLDVAVAVERGGERRKVPQPPLAARRRKEYAGRG